MIGLCLTPLCHTDANICGKNSVLMAFDKSAVKPGQCPPPFCQIDIIGAMMIIWRVRRKIIRSVLCSIVCNNCAQCNAHTHEQS